MPLTKSAIKKVRVDKKRTATNVPIKGRLKNALKEVRLKPSTETLQGLYSAMDRAVKHNIVNKRHASRVKSRLAKFLKSK